ncbi:MAG: hypothetical protein BWK73_30820 [Thiothrix lacustris]|uniref:Type I restriction modification DNA specificity domain-containing protein n=1 Tax=Thiothrix lacustris TaxID=525917 RepID=A0A1Y1QIH5_9GAMM|nr:MAG: hypothetical protein BWK73_30820 [Thiothrix lacustris]
MSIKTKTPALRFKNFTEEWESKKIGKILNEVKRPIELFDKELYQLVTVKRRNEGVFPRSLLKGSDILVKSYFIIKAGDFLISKRQVVHGANGIVPNRLDNAVVSNEYLVVTNNEHITTKFWTVISKRTEMHKLFFVSSYGVDIEKLVFDVSDWGKRTIVIPQLIEQERITDYFQQLDTLIAQHQQKREKLLNLKKALLEKMFPKQGATVPEIRFKGFSGEWEENEFLEIVSRQTAMSNANELPRIEYEDIISGKGKLNKDIWEKESSKIGIKFERDDILFGKLRPYLRNWLLPNFEGIAVGDFWVLRARAKSSDFVYFLIQTTAFEQAANLSSGSKMPRSDWGLVSKTLFRSPEKITEQAKIGGLFREVDRLIAQHQAQLTKLGNIKQACLERMFV